MPHLYPSESTKERRPSHSDSHGKESKTQRLRGQWQDAVANTPLNITGAVTWYLSMFCFVSIYLRSVTAVLVSSLRAVAPQYLKRTSAGTTQLSQDDEDPDHLADEEK